MQQDSAPIFSIDIFGVSAAADASYRLYYAKPGEEYVQERMLEGPIHSSEHIGIVLDGRDTYGIHLYLENIQSIKGIELNAPSSTGSYNLDFLFRRGYGRACIGTLVLLNMITLSIVFTKKGNAVFHTFTEKTKTTFRVFVKKTREFLEEFESEDFSEDIENE